MLPPVRCVRSPADMGASAGTGKGRSCHKLGPCGRTGELEVTALKRDNSGTSRGDGEGRGPRAAQRYSPGDRGRCPRRQRPQQVPEPLDAPAHARDRWESPRLAGTLEQSRGQADTLPVGSPGKGWAQLEGRRWQRTSGRSGWQGPGHTSPRAVFVPGWCFRGAQHLLAPGHSSELPSLLRA